MFLKDLVKIPYVKKIKFTDHDVAADPGNIGGGIYRLYNKVGKIIYVGKSNDLHRRLLQHFGKDTNTAYFIDEVDFAEVHIENCPIMRTLLEGIFIALHKPKYNDEVKDSLKEQTK